MFFIIFFPWVLRHTSVKTFQLLACERNVCGSKASIAMPYFTFDLCRHMHFKLVFSHFPLFD